MAKKKGSRIPVATMFAFGRGCGNPLKNGISPYPQVSDRLEAMGHTRCGTEGLKAHCLRFIDEIRKIASGHRKPRSKKPSSDWKPSLPLSVSPESDSFLQTYEWRRVRMMALKKYGPVCQCCGATPKTGAVMNVDHIKPRKLFPDFALDVSNLQILCHECNHGKGNWDMTDWRSSSHEDLESLKPLGDIHDR